MNDLKNLLLWYAYNEDGEIEAQVRIQALPPDFDLDKYFEAFMSGYYAGGGVDEIKREYITVPPRLSRIEGVAFVMYVNGKRFRAALPYFVTISGVDG